MNNMMQIKSNSNLSGDIVVTNDYMVIKGAHYNIREWYLKKSYDNVVIKRNDILEIEYVKMRSKRALMLFVFFMSVWIFCYGKIFRLNEIIFIVWIGLSVIAMFYYLFKTYKLLRITSIGITIAVEIKHYNKNQLDYLIYQWIK